MIREAARYDRLRWDADANRWESVKQIIGSTRVTLGPQASQQWLEAPEHLSFVLARYRAAAALIGDAKRVLEVGCGEGIGAGILARGRERYLGLDSDAEALKIAVDGGGGRCFVQGDALTFGQDGATGGFGLFDAVVSLDVIEHIPAEHEDRLLASLTGTLYKPFGALVLGTPNAAFDHLASPQSKAGHINTYTHTRLHALMSRYFQVVQSFGLQDTALHLGHPDARHYLLFCGIGPRR